jgi:hypothetical protein
LIPLTGGVTAVTANAWESGYTNSVAATALFLVQPLAVTSEAYTNHVFQLQFSGAPGSNYVLQATTDFTTWTPVMTNMPVTNIFLLMDTNASNYPYRFYRVIQQ